MEESSALSVSPSALVSKYFSKLYILSIMSSVSSISTYQYDAPFAVPELPRSHQVYTFSESRLTAFAAIFKIISRVISDSISSNATLATSTIP